MKQLITAILLLVAFWAIMWGGCAVSEECYKANTNQSVEDIQKDYFNDGVHYNN